MRLSGVTPGGLLRAKRPAGTSSSGSAACELASESCCSPSTALTAVAALPNTACSSTQPLRIVRFTGAGPGTQRTAAHHGARRHAARQPENEFSCTTGSHRPQVRGHASNWPLASCSAQPSEKSAQRSPRALVQLASSLQARLLEAAMGTGSFIKCSRKRGCSSALVAEEDGGNVHTSGRRARGGESIQPGPPRKVLPAGNSAWHEPVAHESTSTQWCTATRMQAQ